MTENRKVKVSESRGASRLGRNLLLVFAALVVSLLLCELLLRFLGIGYPVYYWTDPIRGVAHIPGARSLHKYKGRSWVEINRDGMRGPEVSLKHPPGTYRIALLGDSFIEAFEVPYEKTAGEVLERRLSAARRTPVEVLNFGTGGYGTSQELLTLQHKVWKYSPDLVLLAVTTANDIADNYRPLKGFDYVPYHVFRGTELVVDSSFLQSKGYRGRSLWTRRLLGVVQYSRLAQLLNRVRHLQRKEERLRDNAPDPTEEAGLSNEIDHPPASPEWSEAWRVTEGLLRAARDECRKHNTPFAIVTLSRGKQVNPNLEERQKYVEQSGVKDLYYAERRLAQLGRRDGIPVLNLAPIMAKQAGERHVYFHGQQQSLGIGHWTEEGNRVAGELIAAWLDGDLADSSYHLPKPDLTIR